MHITTVCPVCESLYQVDPSLRGRKMRCPNPLCREVFEVQETTRAAPADPPPQKRPSGPAAPPASKHESGTVGEFIPILAAEEVTPPAPAPPADSTWSPESADLVPIEEEEVIPTLELEAVEPEPPPADAPSWKEPPPVRRPGAGAEKSKKAPVEQQSSGASTQGIRRARKPRPEQKPLPAPPAPTARPERPPRSDRTAPAAPTLPDTAGEPLEMPPGEWTPPPVRRGAAAAETVEPVEAVEEPAPRWEPSVPHARRRAGCLIVGILIAVLAIVGGAGWFAWTTLIASEARLREQAMLDYKEERYRDAAGRFRGLAEKFPDSSDLAEYQFLALLSDRNGDLRAFGANAAAELDRTSEFVKKHRKEPLLKEHARDLGRSLQRLFENFTADAESNGDLAALAVLERGEQTLADLARHFPDSLTPAERSRLAEQFHKVRDAVVRRDRYQKVLDQLDELAGKASADAIRTAQRLIKEAARDRPDLPNDPKVVERLARIYEGHRQNIHYTPAEAPPVVRADRPLVIEPGLLVDQLVAGQPMRQPGNERLVLALARGVLYALAADTGEVQWATRVGIDTTSLPLRVPATPASPEMFLVLSADTTTLTALDTGGRPIWTHRLSAACLSRPVLVDQRAFVPTYDGQVHEIELARGHALGRFRLGQPLSVGGARQPGTHLLYFPADDLCIYVLNVDPALPPAQRRCEMVLYSGHPSGSLRSEPILASWADRGMNPAGLQGFLILNQTRGLDTVQLNAYELPLQDPHARPLTMKPAPTTRGWTWFAPYHDPEKLVLATDAGVLGLFGIRQPRNQDNPLFPLLQEEVRISDSPGTALGRRSRAQVVHVQENDFWVLSQGRLQRFQLSFDRKRGPRVTPFWQEPLVLGSPLHDSQVLELADGAGTGLLVVSQSLDRQTCLATLVDAEDGQVRWQRQLGLVSQGEPLVVGAEVLTLDQGGGLFLFDPRRQPHRPDREWQVGGQSVARPLDHAPGLSPYLLPGPDDMLYEIAPTRTGIDLVVRRYHPERGEEKASLTEHTFELPAPLAGAPALSSGGILLPLADGRLRRLNLPLGDAAGIDGPDWKLASLVEPRAHVVWLDEQEFLTSDGGRGLTRWHWPKGGVWHALPRNKDPRNASLELPARIVSAPVVLPRAEAKEELRIAVADAEGNLSLVAVKGDRLQVVRRWPLGGKITTGPFVRGSYLGCVVDRRRLVWLDPEQEKPLWEYTSAGEGIVGQPQQIEKLLVVADLSGRYVGLDPATGQPRGPGYLLKANVAPAASPVAFGPNRVFAPLTDGTVLLLPLDRLLLLDPLRGMPASW